MIQRERAFSLSEVLIALALVALLALGVLLMVGGGLGSLLASRSSGVCLQLCEQQMSSFLAAPRKSLKASSGQFTGLYAWYRWTLSTQPAGGVLRLTVTVHGKPGESATLTAYARDTAGQIVFSRSGNNISQIWSCQADGTDLQQLTHDTSFNRTPTLSPDGKTVAYVSNRSVDGLPQIYLLDIATGRVTGVTHQATGASAPAWSGDGRLAYTANDNGVSNIFITTPSTGNGTDVSLSTTSHETAPAWSPDGTRLSWVTDRYGSMDIVVADAGANSVSRVTTTPGWNAAPAWCPDGSGRIAFLSTQDGQPEICLANASGGPVTQLTHDALDIQGAPSWSSTGEQILFAREPHGLPTFFIINVDGTGQRPLWPKVTVASQDPSWVR